MTSPTAIKIELAGKIETMLAEKGEINLSKMIATLSIATGYNEKTIRKIVETMAKAERLTVTNNKILPFS